MQLSCSPQKIFARHTHRSQPGPDLVPTSVQTQPNQPKWSRLPEKLKFEPWRRLALMDRSNRQAASFNINSIATAADIRLDFELDGKVMFEVVGPWPHRFYP